MKFTVEAGKLVEAGYIENTTKVILELSKILREVGSDILVWEPCGSLADDVIEFVKAELKETGFVRPETHFQIVLGWPVETRIFVHFDPPLSEEKETDIWFSIDKDQPHCDVTKDSISVSPSEILKTRTKAEILANVIEIVTSRKGAEFKERSEEKINSFSKIKEILGSVKGSHEFTYTFTNAGFPYVTKPSLPPEV